jgi:pimeloyl-ACP methyl ester carboxylesterase
MDNLDKRKIRFVEINGIRTRYYEDGSGELLVLFHGGQIGTLYSLDSWSLNLPELAEHFHVYAVDRLGQGYTDKPKKDTDYTFSATLDHARGFLQVLGIRKAHLVGHSRAGLLVARLALDHPELVKTIIIVDSGTLAPDNAECPVEAFYAELTQRTPPGPPTPETARIEPDAQSFSKEHITGDFVERLCEIGQLPQHQEAQERMRALGSTIWASDLDQHRRETLSQIAQRGFPSPALLIWAVNDPSAPLALAHTLFQIICKKTRITELHVFNRAGHYVFREQPDAFSRLLRSFCLRHFH